jgi:hypothetical protein
MRFFIAAVFVVLACTTAAKADWTTDATQTILAQPGFEDHTVSLMLTTATNIAFFGIDIPYGQPLVFDTPGFCIDRDHDITPFVIQSNFTWMNLIDEDNTVECLDKIATDEPGFYSPVACNLTDPGVLAESTNPVLLDDVSAQMALTADWCDVRRILKYRRAIVWLMENREALLNEATPGFLQCTEPSYKALHLQYALWQVIENNSMLRIGTSDESIIDTPDIYFPCVGEIITLMFAHNEDGWEQPTCEDDGTSVEAIVPIIAKDPLCIDGNSETNCQQYLLIEQKIQVPCDPIDPVDECVCKEATMSCLCGSDIDIPSTCGCISWVPDTDAGVCTVSNVDCPV